MRAVYNTPHEAFCIALVLTNCVVNYQILIASKPKRTKTPFTIYMSAQPLPIGAFGMGDDIAKVKFLYDNALFFNEKVLGKSKKIYSCT